MPIELQNPLIVALDLDSRDECLLFSRLLEGRVGAIKLGPRLVVRYGASLIQDLSPVAPVFVDMKFLDIPSTMTAAVRASFESGAQLITVHAWAGREALTKLAKLENELSAKGPIKILAVTVLTSFSKENLPPGLGDLSIEEHVQRLAEVAIDSGINGLVCSPEEVASLRKRHPSAFLVTPGIRPPDSPASDQVRVMTARQAIDAGASAIVVGRPIVDAADPQEAVERLLAQIQ